MISFLLTSFELSTDLNRTILNHDINPVKTATRLCLCALSFYYIDNYVSTKYSQHVCRESVATCALTDDRSSELLVLGGRYRRLNMVTSPQSLTFSSSSQQRTAELDKVTCQYSQNENALSVLTLWHPLLPSRARLD